MRAVERLRPEPMCAARRRASGEGRQAAGPWRSVSGGGHPENGEVSRLVLVMGRDGFKAGGKAYHFLQYVHISLGEFGFWDDGQHFTFVFSDLQPKLVTVRGAEPAADLRLYQLAADAVDSPGGSGFPPERRGGRRGADHHGDRGDGLGEGADVVTPSDRTQRCLSFVNYISAFRRRFNAQHRAEQLE